MIAFILRPLAAYYFCKCEALDILRNQNLQRIFIKIPSALDDDVFATHGTFLRSIHTQKSKGNMNELNLQQTNLATQPRYFLVYV